MTSNNLNRLERVIALLSLGIKHALDEKLIDIHESERLLFSPDTMSILREIGAMEDLVTLIHYGTELEDIERLLPEKLDAALAHIGKLATDLLRKTAISDSQLDNWLCMVHDCPNH